MESATNVHLVPFLGLLNLIKVKYLDTPEVFHTLITILCDFNPQRPECVARTKRYVRTLLLREPDLAQCMVTFLDEPQLDMSLPTTRLDLSAPDTIDAHFEGNCNNNASPSTNRHGTSPEPDTGDTTSPAASSETANQSFTLSQLSSSSTAGSTRSMFCGNASSEVKDWDTDVDMTDVALRSCCTKVHLSGGQEGGASLTSSTSPSGQFVKNHQVQTSAVASPHLFNLCDLRNAGLLHATWLTPAGASHPSYGIMPMPFPCLIPAPLFPGTACIRLPPLDEGSLSQAALSTLGTNRAKPSSAAAAASAAASLLLIPSMQQTETVTGNAAGMAMKKHSLLPAITTVSSTTTNGTSPKSAQARIHSSHLVCEDQPATAQFLSSNTNTLPITGAVQSTTTPLESGLVTSSYSQASSTSSLCLSQLLGQPSVTTLPVGSFLDKRNHIVGGQCMKTSPRKKPGEELAKEKTTLSSTANRPLQPLSAQAGSRSSFKVSSASALTSSGIEAIGSSRIAPIFHSPHLLLTSGAASPRNPSSASNLISGKSPSVQASLGSNSSLASFPYIQQMVLPDGQVSCVSLHHPQVLSGNPNDPSTQPLPATQKLSDVHINLALHKTVSPELSKSPRTLLESSDFKNKETEEISTKTKKYSKISNKFVYTLPEGKHSSPDSSVPSVHNSVDLSGNAHDVIKCYSSISRTSLGKMKTKRKRVNNAESKLPPISRSSTKLKNVDNL